MAKKKAKKQKKLYVVYYPPTAETWYYTDRRLAIKTMNALERFDIEHYGCSPLIDIDEEVISESVVFEP